MKKLASLLTDLCPPMELAQSYYIGVDSILLDPAVSKIFYFKLDVGASRIITF